ncbi:unnamed protein product [Thelazia callipaeda]|uniref:EGF-like domain-containing protein n=1 Tax=Thelazia callipaeda TaxID=103827 RepID=A0A0N5D7Q2_THECL|nr:unnamed protein product [Thelazia callipaeda]
MNTSSSGNAAQADIRRALVDGVSSRVVYEGNICETYPCWNDAICVPINTTTATYKCICQNEYTGSYCQYKISNYCKAINCRNKTVCTVQNGIATCIADNLIVKQFALIMAGVYKKHQSNIVVHVLMVFKESTAIAMAINASLITSGMTSESIFLLVSLFILLLLSIFMIYMGSNGGCYLILPGETRYLRWETTDNEASLPTTSTVNHSLSSHTIKMIDVSNSPTIETVIDLDEESISI